jgi:hypothetical protein
VLGHQRAVGVHHAVHAVRGEGQDLIGLAVVQVVKKDAAQAARLAAVLDQEVLVAPLLELGVEGGVVAVTHLGGRGRRGAGEGGVHVSMG